MSRARQPVSRGSEVYLIEVPVEGGGRLLVQATDSDLSDRDLQFAARRPGAVITQAGQSLERALDQLTPALRAVRDRLVAMAPDEVNVEFALTLGAEAGVVLAKGSSEVHFAVTLNWKNPRQGSAPDDG